MIYYISVIHICSHDKRLWACMFSYKFSKGCRQFTLKTLLPNQSFHVYVDVDVADLNIVKNTSLKHSFEVPRAQAKLLRQMCVFKMRSLGKGVFLGKNMVGQIKFNNE